MKLFLALILFSFCLPLAAQTSFEELVFESDSITSKYKPSGKNHVFIRSKRGSNGVNRTTSADSALTLPVSEIVLVFSEVNYSSFEEREDANRERWENLLMTYPEFFQFSTTYKNLCQCNFDGDEDAFKKAQGFYVYLTQEESKTKTKTVEAKKTEDKKVEKSVPSVPAPAPEKTEPVKVVKTTIKEAEVPVAAPETNKEVVKEKKETIKENVNYDNEDQPETPVKVKERPKRSAELAKPRKSKDPKACRPACYEGGDEDLNAFFKSYITLSKKQKRKGKKLNAVVKLQLHFDGTIKKAIVTGEDETFNKQVQEAANMMNRWNPAVKSGMAIKSEVKITLKYDRECKCAKPFEVAVIPRPAPKCKCASDEEIFGSAD